MEVFFFSNHASFLEAIEKKLQNSMENPHRANKAPKRHQHEEIARSTGYGLSMASEAPCFERLPGRTKVQPNHAVAPFVPSYADLVVQDGRLVDSLNTVSGWKYSMMLTEEGNWRRIKFRTMESPAQEVAGTLGLRIATRTGAKVEKIIEIKWNDGPNGADIGGPDVQELWLMDEFMWALANTWCDKKGIVRALKTIEPKNYPSYTKIVIKQPLVSLVNFLYY